MTTRPTLGAPGPRGFRGTQGTQGSQASTGEVGSQGSTGYQGGNISVLNDLLDVTIDSNNIENGETIIYDATGAVWINGLISHTSLDLSTLTSYSGSTAANEALGVGKAYLLDGDDCLYVTEATGM